MNYGLEELRAIVRRFADFIRSAVPADGTVAVVSKGDAELLEIDGRSAWHFPQRADGTYAGYYPFDSASAIAHLEELRGKGADHLAFPLPRPGGWTTTSNCACTSRAITKWSPRIPRPG